MNLDVQFKLKSNPNYIKYLRENSYWYKILNRNPEMFQNFENEVKEKYKLRPSDKITKALEMIEIFQNVITNLK